MFSPRRSPISFFTAAAIAVVFCWTYIQDCLRFEANKSCMVAYDQLGYYSYLPAYFIYDDLQFEGEWIENVQANCGNPGTYQFNTLENGNKVNIYHMGLAFIQLPGFLIADQIAQSSDRFERNGVSAPYYISVRLTAALFVLLGLFFLRRILLSFFTDKIVAVTLILLFGGTNLFITFFYGELMPHLYLFTLNTLFIYLLLKYYRSKKLYFLIASAFIFGLTTAIRPTQAIWGIIPAVLLFFQADDKLKTLAQLILFPLTILIFNAPQLFYWKFMSGSWFVVNLHSETLNLLRPYTLDFLFSYKKGWLLYSPLLLLSFFGLYFMFQKDKWMGRAFAVFIVLNIWVLSSWDCWWYASSFGSRVMVDSYVVFAVLLGFIVQYLSTSSRALLLAGSIFSVGVIYLNALQSYQYYKGIISLSTMTKDHYWYVFGKWEMPDIDRSALELNRADLNWPTTLLKEGSYAKELGYSLWENKNCIDTADISFGAPEEYKDIYTNRLDDLFPTDETLLDLAFEFELSDTQGDLYVVLRLNNTTQYFVEYIPAHGYSVVQHRVNLPVVRRMSDEIKLFIWNLGGNSGRLKSFNLSSTSLVR